MVDSTGLQLPPPADWPAFERITRQLFARAYGCPIAEMIGRSGQDQEGLDIIGRRPDGVRGYFGIQCKLKDSLGKSRDLRRKTLEEEVARAEKIHPPLAEFVLVTTAANDVDLQNHARALTAARNKTPHPIDIQVIGWNQFRAMIGEHRDILEGYLGISGVAALAEQSAAQHIEAMENSAAQLDELKQMMERVLTATQAPAHIVVPPLEGDDPKLTRAIERIKAKLSSDDVRGALSDLEALREDEWADASAAQRFKILSNLGAARWRLGEHDVAGILFREAADIRPDDPIGLANLATAAISASDYPQALQAARRLLQIDPDSTDALLPLIQAQEQVAPPVDPMDVVPSALHDSEEAMVGAAQVLRNRGDDRWLALVERGIVLYPASDLLARLHADATLQRMATVEGAHVGACGEAIPSWQDVEAAAATLDRLWRSSLACDPTHPDLSIPYNLANALRALERNDEALAVLEQAERFAPEQGQIAHLHALLLASLGRNDEARERLRKHLDDPPSRILLCQLLEHMPAEVRALLADVEMPVGSREAIWQRILDTEARAALEPGFDPTADLEEAARAFPSSLIPLLGLGKRAITTEAQAAVANRLVDVANLETPFADILHASLWLRQAGLPGPIASLLEDRVSRSEDSVALRWLIEAWFDLDDRAALIATLDALPAHVGDLPRFIYFRQSAAYRAGDMPTALDAVDRLIELDPENLGRRLDWIQILHRWRIIEPVESWLATDVERLDGSPEQRADLALLLANHGLYDRARHFAYRLARLHPDNRRALERYTGVMMNPAPSGLSELGLSRIGPDAVFTVVDDSGNERIYRIDAERDLPTEAIDLGPDSPVALAADGLQEGDSFEVPAGLAGMPPRRFRVGSVLHKHIHLFRWLTDVLPERFDGPQVIYKTTINPEDGTGLEPLVHHMRKREEAARAVNTDYRENARPIQVIAAIFGRRVIDTYDSITSSEDTGFICSEGGGPEFDLEVQSLELNRRRGCIVDTITMELIRRHDLLDVVRAVAGSISISQGTLDDFIERADKGELLVGRLQGHLSQHDGNISASRVHPAQIDTAIDDWKSALEWLSETTQVRPAIGPPGLARRLAAMLPGQLEGQFQDEVLVAADTGFLLLSDDLGYRRFAAAMGIGRRAGLAALLRLAIAREVIDLQHYVKVIAALGRARHRFIAADSEDMMTALELDGGEMGPTLRGIASLIGGPRANIAAQWQEVSQFLRSVWNDDALVSHRLAVATLFADNLLAAAPIARRDLSASLFRNPDEVLSIFSRAVTAACAEQANKSAREPQNKNDSITTEPSQRTAPREIDPN